MSMLLMRDHLHPACGPSVTRRGDTEREAAEAIRAVLALVASVELIASTRQALAMVRRLEGAAMALEEAGKAKNRGLPAP